MEETYTCPWCGRTTYNPNDVQYKYCGNCHQFEGIRKFHEHLDVCERCRNRCFDLCPQGAVLLRDAAYSVGFPRPKGGNHG